MNTRILIADDHDVVRAGLTAILSSEPGMEVVGEARTAEEATLMAEKLAPELVLIDISMPAAGGIEATRLIVEQAPGCKVVILTIHEDESLVREAIRAGAAGYILKRAVKTELIGAIHTVLQGDMYIHPAMMRSLMAHFNQPPAKAVAVEEPLTEREVEVLRYIAQGYTNQQIADLIYISVRTVEYHRSNLMDKLHLKSRVDLVRYATEHGVI
jgi:two-component system response regulator NreC